MQNQCRSEIVDLHQFFEAWFKGQVAATDQVFSRLDTVLAESFVLISPDGHMAGRGPLLGALKAGHGQRPRFKIWIEAFNLKQAMAGHYLVTYEEWQIIDGVTNARLSTAVFRDKPDTPHGVEWVHVHETWLESEQSPA